LLKAEQAVALLGPQPTLEQAGRITIARPAAGYAPNATPMSDVTCRLGFRLPEPPHSTPSHPSGIDCNTSHNSGETWRTTTRSPSMENSGPLHGRIRNNLLPMCPEWTSGMDTEHVVGANRFGPA
jgi:hypothetical protein